MMTKTIEEQIEEARDDLAYARTTYRPEVSTMGAAHDRAVARAASRLATLEAVRDGRMVAVYATVCVEHEGAWAAYGAHVYEHDHADVMEGAMCQTSDAITILRGYAHVPSTQVHEAEADSEVPS
jgi:hypothetical protein